MLKYSKLMRNMFSPFINSNTFECKVGDQFIAISKARLLLIACGLSFTTSLIVFLLTAMFGQSLFIIFSVVAPLVLLYVYSQLDDVINSKVIGFITEKVEK